MRKAGGFVASLAAPATLLLIVYTSIVVVEAQSRALAVAAADAQLSSLEKEIFREINLARANPVEYAAHLEKLKPFFSGKTFQPPGKLPLVTNEGWSAVEDAIRFMRSTRPLQPLAISRGMCMGAFELVKDQKTSGNTGHKGSDNSLCDQRVTRFGVWRESIGENLVYGTDSARERVITLLIDDGVANRGHRKRILSPEYKVVGISCGDHCKLGGMCVITFAGGFTDSLAGGGSKVKKPTAAVPSVVKQPSRRAPRQL